MDNPIAADAFGVHHATTILGNLQMQGASRTLPENVEVLSAQSAIQPCPWRTSVCSTKTRRTCPDPTWSKLRSIRCHRLPSCFVSLPKSLQWDLHRQCQRPMHPGISKWIKMEHRLKSAFGIFWRQDETRKTTCSKHFTLQSLMISHEICIAWSHLVQD